MAQGEHEGVESMLRRELTILENAYGPVHPRVGMALNNLGSFLVASGRSDEAIDLLRRSFEVERAALGPDHPDVAYPLVTLADAHLATGRIEQSRNAYRRAVATRRRALDPGRFDPVFFYALVGRGRTETELGNADVAEQSLERALAIWDQSPRSTDVRLGSPLRYLGGWLIERRRCAEAVPLLQRAAVLSATSRTPPDQRTQEIDGLLAACAGSRSVSTEALN